MQNNFVVFGRRVDMNIHIIFLFKGNYSKESFGSFGIVQINSEAIVESQRSHVLYMATPLLARGA